MSFYDVNKGTWSETDPHPQVNSDQLLKAFPGVPIVVRSDGIVEIRKGAPLSVAEQQAAVTAIQTPAPVVNG